jgi:hypothetical protein
MPPEAPFEVNPFRPIVFVNQNRRDLIDKAS